MLDMGYYHLSIFKAAEKNVLIILQLFIAFLSSRWNIRNFTLCGLVWSAALISGYMLLWQDDLKVHHVIIKMTHKVPEYTF